MKTRIIILFAVVLLSLGVQAQELTVKSMTAAPMDLSASKYERKDLTGKPCALVKVQLATEGAKFQGNVIGNTAYDTGEYWVYMSEGSYMLSVKHPSFVPLNVNFRNYDIDGVKSKVTYTLTLVRANDVIDGMHYLVLNVEPANSTVYIDDKVRQVVGGSVRVPLNEGTHSYRVEAKGYTMESGNISVENADIVKDVTLKSLMATLRVNCPSAQAEVYVNGRKYGVVPWQGQLEAGNYSVELRLDGHRSQKRSVTLKEKQESTVDFPELKPITGKLEVSYQPEGAEVWIDGTLRGRSPVTFRDLIAGRHEVETRKSGFTTKKEVVTITEGQTVRLSGVLKAQTVTQTQTVMPPQTVTSSQTLSQTQSVVNSTNGGAIETFSVNGVSFNMVRVDGGTFRMGSDDSEADRDEKPVHDVTLTSYSIGETEVTQDMWEAVMGKNPSNFKGAKRPVEQVSWDDCQEFISRLNQMTGKKFRMPTEAEWEYAARGGKLSKNYKYSGSNSIGDVAWYGDNSGGETHVVKTKKPNELGLYDMSGNVWEWCQDWYEKDYYSSSPQGSPTGPSIGSYRVRRGGSRNYVDGNCRVSYRTGWYADNRSDYLGLRLAKDSEEIVLHDSPSTTRMTERGNTTDEAEPIRRDIFFKPNKGELTDQELGKIKDLADYKKKHPNAKFTITGFAALKSDNKAKKDELSINRAMAVRNALIKDFGINDKSIRYDGKGEKVQPFVDDDNNRVVIVIGE